MAERLNAPVLKTGMGLHPIGGSNPSLSATVGNGVIGNSADFESAVLGSSPSSPASDNVTLPELEGTWTIVKNHYTCI